MMSPLCINIAVGASSLLRPPRRKMADCPKLQKKGGKVSVISYSCESILPTVFFSHFRGSLFPSSYISLLNLPAWEPELFLLHSLQRLTQNVGGGRRLHLLSLLMRRAPLRSQQLMLTKSYIIVLPSFYSAFKNVYGWVLSTCMFEHRCPVS